MGAVALLGVVEYVTRATQQVSFRFVVRPVVNSMWVRGVVTGQSLVTLNDGRADSTHDMRAHLPEATA